MNRLIQLNKRTSLFLVVFGLACFALPPRVQAVVPAPDGGYPGANTAEGTQALQSLTTGIWNTALGFQALFSDTTGKFNTAIGVRALYRNTTGIENTATGVQALYSNTTGDYNTANGFNALLFNTEGVTNTATGFQALYSNTTGHTNTANGVEALVRNTTGNANTGTGVQALWYNTTGNFNTAYGVGALSSNISGSSNIALGLESGTRVFTADNVICIGTNVSGENVSNTCYIGNIFGVTSAGATAVYVNSLGKLGTVVSARRFKDEIKPMDKASEAILALKPVTFRYKQEIDPAHSPQFGLVAEDVEKVNPDLVVRDRDGKLQTVRYEAVNAMLLNEFLKEHGQVQELKGTVAQQQKEIQALTARLEEQAAQIQKVSAQLEANKSAVQVVNNP
jgi:hypothetical protein